MSPVAELKLSGFCATLVPSCAGSLSYWEGVGAWAPGTSVTEFVVFFFFLVGTLEKHVLCREPGIQQGESCQAEKCLSIP